MTTILTHQPRPFPAFHRQHSACIAYPSSHLIPNQSQSSSSMDPHSRPYRTIRPSQFPPPHHHSPHTPPHSHHSYRLQRTSMATATATPVSFPRRSSPSLSSTYPLVYSPAEHSYQNTPSMSADIQHEYPFDIGFATGSAMSFADLDLSQTAFLNPGQLPWPETKSDFKLESPPTTQPVFYADPGSYPFYNDSNGSPAVEPQLFPPQSEPQPRPQPRPPSEILASTPQQVVYFSPAAETEMEMEGDMDLHYPTSSPPPHPLSTSGAPAFVHPSDVMSSSPPAFAATVPFPRVQGSSSPPGLTGESDEDIGSESGESEAAYPSDGADGDDDGDFMPHRTSGLHTRSRRTSSVSLSSGSGSVRAPRPCRLSAPVPVPNLTKKSRGRRVPTAPVFMVQGGVQKNMRMYRCNVEGCYKCFARGEHLKRHVRSIHTNEKRTLSHMCFFVLLTPHLQRTSVPSKDAGRISVVTITLGNTCASTRVKQ
jgi:hypothetical protein